LFDIAHRNIVEAFNYYYISTALYLQENKEFYGYGMQSLAEMMEHNRVIRSALTLLSTHGL